MNMRKVVTLRAAGKLAWTGTLARAATKLGTRPEILIACDKLGVKPPRTAPLVTFHDSFGEKKTRPLHPEVKFWDMEIRDAE